MSSAPAPAPFDPEARRLAVLHSLALAGDDASAELDALVALAAQTVRCGAAMLTLVDRDRIRVKASSASTERWLPRRAGLCHHTIGEPDMLVVEDLAIDARFARDPLLTAQGGTRFYAGIPIRLPDDDGQPVAIGALCVVDSVPHELAPAEAAALRALALLAESLIGARRTAIEARRVADLAERQSRTLAEQDRMFRQTERIATVGSWRLDLGDQRMEWSDGMFRVHDLPTGQPPTAEEALGFYSEEDGAALAAAVRRTIETGEPFDLESDFTTAGGRSIRVRSMGQLDRVDGRAKAIVGVFQDVTERHALETSLRRSADTDWMTGLANRAAFDRKLGEALTASLADGAPLVLALVDLDGFKLVNDTLGHQAGDDVLRAIARKLSAAWLNGSFAARIGGDEFALIVDDRGLANEPDRLQRLLQDSMHATVTSGGVRMTCAGTVGLARLPRDCRSVRDFVHRVDQILYAAKRHRVGDRRRPARRVA